MKCRSGARIGTHCGKRSPERILSRDAPARIRVAGGADGVALSGFLAAATAADILCDGARRGALSLRCTWKPESRAPEGGTASQESAPATRALSAALAEWRILVSGVYTRQDSRSGNSLDNLRASSKSKGRQHEMGTRPCEISVSVVYARREFKNEFRRSSKDALGRLGTVDDTSQPLDTPASRKIRGRRLSFTRRMSQVRSLHLPPTIAGETLSDAGRDALGSSRPKHAGRRAGVESSGRSDGHRGQRAARAR